MATHQTHGLVTDRSAGDEDGHLGAVLAAALQQLGRVGLASSPAGCGWSARRESAASARRSARPSPPAAARRGAARCAGRRPWCARGRSRRGRCADRGSSRSSRSRPCRTWRRRCTSPRPLVTDARLEGRRRGDQGHARLGQRLGQRRERHVGEVRPAIGREADGLIVVTRALHVGNRHVVLGGNRHRCLPWAMRQCPTSPAAASRPSGRPYGRGATGRPARATLLRELEGLRVVAVDVARGHPHAAQEAGSYAEAPPFTVAAFVDRRSRGVVRLRFFVTRPVFLAMDLSSRGFSLRPGCWQIPVQAGRSPVSPRFHVQRSRASRAPAGRPRADGPARYPRNSSQVSSQACVVSASDSTSMRSSLPWKRPDMAS